jgi:hypothetical protein
MSLVFAKGECMQALLDFLVYTDISRVSGVVEEAENSDYEELSNGGTGKNDHARHTAHREAVSGTVNHSIFDVWH